MVLPHSTAATFADLVGVRGRFEGEARSSGGLRNQQSIHSTIVPLQRHCRSSFNLIEHPSNVTSCT